MTATSDAPAMQFPLERYMEEDEVNARKQAKDFKAFVFALRSSTSDRPKCGFKGVAQRQTRFEARNSPFPVRNHWLCLYVQLRMPLWH